MFAILLAACTVRPAVTEMSLIAEGAYAREDSGRQAVLAVTEDEYRRLWSEKIGRDPVPEADFEKGVVVFLLAGMRNSGGWSVIPDAVEVTDDTAVIRARVQGPGGGKIVTQALTSPYAVVFITNRDVKRVQWPQ